MKKRIVSGIMCLAMLLSLLPVSAFAVTTPEQPADLASYKIAKMGIAANKAAVPIDRTSTGGWTTDDADNAADDKYLYVELNKAAPAGYTIVVNVYPENKAEGVILSTYNNTAASKALAISFKRIAKWYYGSYDVTSKNFDNVTSLYAQVSVVPVGENGGAPAFTSTEVNGAQKYTFTPNNSITKDSGKETTELVNITTTPYAMNQAFALSAGTPENGTVTFKVDGETVTSAEAGKEVTIVVTPNVGYELDGTVTAKDADDGVVTVTNNKFTMPAKNVTVTATFKKSTAVLSVGALTGTIVFKDEAGMPAGNLGSVSFGDPVAVTGQEKQWTIEATGTANFVKWLAFSSKTEEQQGNYVAMKFVSGVDGAEITANGVAVPDGEFVVILDNSHRYKVEVVVKKGSETLGTYTINLANVTRVPASTDNKIAAATVKNASATVPAAGGTIAAPAEIKNTEAFAYGTNLASTAVVLTVPTTATVKTITTAPINAASFDGAALDITPTEGGKGTVTVSADLGSSKAIYVMVTAQNGDNAFYKVVANVAAPKTDATVSAAKIAGITAVADTTEGKDGSAANKAIGLSAEVPAGTTLNPVQVVLTVDPTATVTTGTTDGAISSVTTNDAGTVTISSVNLDASAALFVKIVAQDDTTTKYYKVTATVGEIAVTAPEPVVPDVPATITGDSGTQATTAGGNTGITTTTEFSNSAYEAVVAAEPEGGDGYKSSTALTQLNALDTVTGADASNTYVYAVPYLEVKAESYDKDAETPVYVVNITPKAKVVLTKEGDYGDVELSGSGKNAVEVGTPIPLPEMSATVEIGVPSGIGGNGTKVLVVHDLNNIEKEEFVREVDASGKVSVDVSHFSKFTIAAISATKLSNLTVDSGSLTPAFSAGVDAYTVSTTANSITVTPTTPDGLTYALKDEEGNVLSNPISLELGANVIKVVVSGSGLTETTYTITVTRTNATNDNTGGGGGGSSATVSVPSTSNGKVSVNNTNAKKGDTVTITVTPNTGYEVGTVTVKDANGNAVNVTKVNDTTYTFVMPDGKVSVDATFTQVQQPSDEPFVDVSASDYFYDAVKWAVDKGITTGDGVNTFGPNKSCTRAQMVTFLWRAAGSPAATGSNPFADVSAGEYYTDAVLWAVSKGITNGTGADSFSPNATVSRGQTVTFLYRYAGSPSVNAGDAFNDVAATDYYANAVQWAVNNGITNGTGNGTFSPVNDCTRGQIVTFMYRQMAE